VGTTLKIILLTIFNLFRRLHLNKKSAYKYIIILFLFIINLLMLNFQRLAFLRVSFSMAA